MLQPKSLYKTVENAARLQREARRVADTAQAGIDKYILDIMEVATAPAKTAGKIMISPDDIDGTYAGQGWWNKCHKETADRDGIPVYLIRAVEGVRAGRVAMMATSMVKWLSRVGWVRKPTDAEIEAERALATATVHPRVIADIGRRLRTARSLHHALPDGQRASSPGHPPRRKGRKRVSAH